MGLDLYGDRKVDPREAVVHLVHVVVRGSARAGRRRGRGRDAPGEKRRRERPVFDGSAGAPLDGRRRRRARGDGRDVGGGCYAVWTPRWRRRSVRARPRDAAGGREIHGTRADGAVLPESVRDVGGVDPEGELRGQVLGDVRETCDFGRLSDDRVESAAVDSDAAVGAAPIRVRGIPVVPVSLHQELLHPPPERAGELDGKVSLRQKLRDELAAALDFGLHLSL